MMRITDFSDEIQLNILSYLSIKDDIPNISQTCTRYFNLIHDPSLYEGDNLTTLTEKNLWNRRYTIETYPCDLSNLTLIDLFSAEGNVYFFCGEGNQSQMRVFNLSDKTFQVFPSLDSVPNNIFRGRIEPPNSKYIFSKAANREWKSDPNFGLKFVVWDQKNLDTYTYYVGGNTITPSTRGKCPMNIGTIRGLNIFGRFLVACAGGSLHVIDKKKMQSLKAFNRFHRLEGSTVIQERKIAAVDGKNLFVIDFGSREAEIHSEDTYSINRIRRTTRLFFEKVKKGALSVKEMYKKNIFHSFFFAWAMGYFSIDYISYSSPTVSDHVEYFIYIFTGLNVIQTVKSFFDGFNEQI